ncbi:hypothetical protein OKA05_29050 [Luteolibacter arcticus]|uniref:Uncharacterized protein n=1 Tax=Luteolibacter arcticus TaxID=1581411 RepID=A0ABT3GT12_9BACT|nr:hypothetical protein [Luteolibacter arcticus]MCW1926636.1 hypothetical protein [Luteolibacter arcticus]
MIPAWKATDQTSPQGPYEFLHGIATHLTTFLLREVTAAKKP